MASQSHLSGLRWCKVAASILPLVHPVAARAFRVFSIRRAAAAAVLQLLASMSIV